MAGGAIYTARQVGFALHNHTNRAITSHPGIGNDSRAVPTRAAISATVTCSAAGTFSA
jgi:hypothetical protein